MVKNLPASAGDLGSVPGLGRFPGERNGNPLQYSCLENPMDRGAWRATVPGVTKSQHNSVTQQQEQKRPHRASSSLLLCENIRRSILEVGSHQTMTLLVP